MIQRWNLNKGVRLLISLLLVLAALYFLDWNKLGEALLRVNPWMFSLAVLSSLCQFVILAIRWHELLRPISSLRAVEHLKYYFYGTFLNAFTPANVGGDIYRFFSTKSHVASQILVVIVLIRERLLGLLSILLTYVVCILLLKIDDSVVMSDGERLFHFAWVVILVGLAIIILLPCILSGLIGLFTTRPRGRLTSVLGNLREAASFNSIPAFIKLIGLSLTAFFIWILTVKVVAIDLNLRMSVIALGAIIVLVELARLVPISVQGIGVREGVFAYLFALFGKSPESGFMLATVSYVVLNISFLISGFLGWSLMYFSHSKQAKFKHTGPGP